MTNRKPPPRHPSTQIPDETVREIAYRWYLRRLEPPMTPGESAAFDYTFTDNHGKAVTVDDAKRRVNSEAFLPQTRDFLRVLVDLGVVVL